MDLELAKLAMEIGSELMKRSKYHEAANWGLKAYRYIESLNAVVNETSAVWAFLVCLYLLASGDEYEWRRYYAIAKSFKYSSDSNRFGDTIFIVERNYFLAEQFVRRHFLGEADEHLYALWHQWYLMPDFLQGPSVRLMIGLAEACSFREDKERESKWYSIVIKAMERYGKIDDKFRQHCLNFVEACKIGNENYQTDGPRLPGWRLSNREIRPSREISPIFDKDTDLRRMVESFKAIENGKSTISEVNPCISQHEETGTAKSEHSLPPSLRAAYSQSPILFHRTPPLEVILPKLPPHCLSETLIANISNFLTSFDNPEDQPLPDLLIRWSQAMVSLDYSDGNVWAAVDLIRAAMSNKHVSQWFLEYGIECLGTIIKSAYLNDENWQLRFVTIRLVTCLVV